MPSSFLLATGVSGVYHLSTVALNQGDGAFGLHLAQSSSGQRATDLHSLDKSGGGDQLHLGHFGVEASQSVFVEQDLGIELLSHLSLVPLLLLGFTPSQGGGELLLLSL